MVLQGSRWVGVPILCHPIHIFPFLASNLDGGEVQDCDFETVTILVIGEIMGGDMGVGTEALEGPHRELTQPGRCIKTHGQAGEHCCIKGVL